MAGQIKESFLRETAKSNGFELLSVSPVTRLADPHTDQLRNWQSSGYAGELHYMERDSDLFVDASNFLANVKTLVCLAVPYAAIESRDLKAGHGRVARYALGRDYHRVIKQRLKKIIAALQQEIPELTYRLFTDAVPLLERAFAASAGIGFVGKNTMLIRPRLGSYFFIAEILLDIEVQAASLPVLAENCGSCKRCLQLCPTGAIVDDYQLDARKCISYLTIEKKGALSASERMMLGEWVFGCDICQEVCPFNHASQKQFLPASIWEELIDPAFADGMLDLAKVLRIRSNEVFLKHFAGRAIMRTGRAGLLRNACCVAVCNDYECLIPAIEEAFIEDSDELIRTHALWALLKLQQSAVRRENYVERARRDSSKLVIGELEDFNLAN